MFGYIVSYIILGISIGITVYGVLKVFKKFNLVYIMRRKADKFSEKHGGELVAQVLQAHGVKYIFSLAGGRIAPILTSSEKLGIRIVDPRHEATAVFAADAVARLSGTLGVAVVTAGPCLTNTITAMKNAQMANSPILLLGGAVATLVKGRGALQDIDQLSLFKTICKFSTSVTSVRDIIPTIRKAIQIALSGTPGPVFVELPMDTLYPYQIVEKEMLLAGYGKGLTRKLNQMYTSYCMSNLFAGAWEPVDSSPLKPDIPMVSIRQVEDCSRLISAAKKPVLLVGSQAALPPTPIEEVRKSLEQMGIPCFLEGMARGLLGANNAIQVRQRRREALKEADLIILAGSVCDFRLSYGRILNKEANIIAINQDKAQLYQNADMFWKPSIAAVGNVAYFLKDLSTLLVGYRPSRDWLELLKSSDTENELANRKISEDTPSQHLNPLKILYELDEILPENAIVVTDGGDFVTKAAHTLRPRGPLQWLDPGAFGTLGVGAGFALGAKICRPESEVWCIFGDGAFGYSLIEFDTLVRHKAPVVALIGNDASWTQMEREQVPIFGTDVACSLVHSNYQVAVEGLGGRGMLLSKEDDVKKSLARARDLVATENVPVVVNALIGKTSFRHGSLSG